MVYFYNLLKKSLKSAVVATVLILVLWGALYHLTDWATIDTYFFTGVGVCAFNTVVCNYQKRKMENLLKVQSSWVIMAGLVLLLYHAGFEASAVFTAAAILASPFFGATMYEGFVGLTLLINLAMLMS